MGRQDSLGALAPGPGGGLVLVRAASGQLPGLIGAVPSGSGKTTLARCIAGLHSNWTGEVTYTIRLIEDVPRLNASAGGGGTPDPG